MLPNDSFFQLAGPNWKLVKAICIRESGGNELAVGDGGDAQGMFQLHAAFAMDYIVPAGNLVLIALRGVPFVSIQIMKNFMAMCGTAMSQRDIIGTFHDGHKGWLERGDKDHYVSDVIQILAKL